MRYQEENLVCVVGLGVMGRSIVTQLLDKGTLKATQIYGIEATTESIPENVGIEIFTDNFSEKFKKTSALILCVKPHQAISALERFSKLGLTEDTLILSIVTGITTSQIQIALSKQSPVIRIITNTPCQIGRGMTAICGGEFTKKSHFSFAEKLFGALGEIVQIDETMCDAMTGLAGSGPAYVYRVIEAMAEGGVRMGLSADVALKAAVQTVVGAATMISQTKKNPATLRKEVSTPGGCTIAALELLDKAGFYGALVSAVERATIVAKDLGKQKSKL